MAYFLRQEKRKNRVYLQMYETYWDKEKKQPRSRSVKAFGYVDALAGPAMPDPVRYYKDFVTTVHRLSGTCRRSMSGTCLSVVFWRGCR